MSLREQIELDLAETLENQSDFGLPIIIKYPDGKIDNLNGQVIYDAIVGTSETGQPIISEYPVVSLRLSTMSQKIDNISKTIISIPETPGLNAAMVSHYGMAIQPNRSIGFCRIFLGNITQTP